MELIRRAGSVKGRVQGVGFRFFTQRTGVRLGVTGWVRNCSDGSVEFQVQGPPDLVNAFIRELREGPPFGRVDDMNVDASTVVPNEQGFDVRF